MNTTASGCSCPWGFYWDASGASPVCTACGAGANTTVIGARSSSQCFCPTGYYGNPKAAPGCTPCGTLGFEGTTAGPSTRITTVASCICIKDYYLGATACEACPINAVTLSIGETRRHPRRGRTAAAAFGCLEPAHAACRLASLPASAAPGQRQLAPCTAAGANAIQSCGCPAGYFGMGSNLAKGCSPCPAISTPYVTGISFDDTSGAAFACSCPRNYYFEIATGKEHCCGCVWPSTAPALRTERGAGSVDAAV